MIYTLKPLVWATVRLWGPRCALFVNFCRIEPKDSRRGIPPNFLECTALRLSALRQVAPLLRLVYERWFAFLHYTYTVASGNISFALSLPVKSVGVLAS